MFAQAEREDALDNTDDVAPGDEPIILHPSARRAVGQEGCESGASHLKDAGVDPNAIDPLSAEAIATDIAKIGVHVMQAAQRQATHILDDVREQCRGLIEETAREAEQIISNAKTIAAEIQRSAKAESERLIAEAQRRAEEAAMAAKRAEEALRAIEAMQVALEQGAGAKYSRDLAGPENNGQDEHHQADASTDRQQTHRSAAAPLLEQDTGATESGISEEVAQTGAGVKPDDRLAALRVERNIAPVLTTATLVAGPFGSFRALMAFQKALDQLEGVRGIKVRRFHKGILYATVHYVGVVPLEQRLKELYAFHPQIITSDEERVEIRVDTGEQRVLETRAID